MTNAHSPSRAPREGGRPRFIHRRRVCAFCADKNLNIDYKRAEMFGRYVSERGTMEPRKKTGNCAKHQRRLAVAIKRARHLALLPFSQKHIRTTGVPIPGSRSAREYVPRERRDFTPRDAGEFTPREPVGAPREG